MDFSDVTPSLLYIVLMFIMHYIHRLHGVCYQIFLLTHYNVNKHLIRHLHIIMR